MSIRDPKKSPNPIPGFYREHDQRVKHIFNPLLTNFSDYFKGSWRSCILLSSLIVKLWQISAGEQGDVSSKEVFKDRYNIVFYL